MKAGEGGQFKVEVSDRPALCQDDGVAEALEDVCAEESTWDLTPLEDVYAEETATEDEKGDEDDDEDDKKSEALSQHSVQTFYSSGCSSSSSESAGSRASSVGERATGTDKAKRRGQGSGGALADTPFFWRGFRFTRTFKKNDEPKGLEVACYHHDPGGLLCRRPRTFNAHGGEERTLRLLKTWCVCVGACCDDAEHKAMPNQIPWSNEELEAADIPPIPDALEQRGAKGRKRARRS